MKKQWIVGSMVFCVSTGMMIAAEGGTDTPYERALLEEEANHNLEAAIQSYQQAVAYFVTNRQMLATAVFRMGECYRKEGKLNEARMQYRRILRDFPEQRELTRLSQQIIGDATNASPAYALCFGNSNPNPADNLAFPGGVAVDAAGNVYVADTKHNRVQKFTGRGDFLLRWGSEGTNTGSFDYPQGLATDGANYVYVADTHNHRVQKFTGDGTFVAQWGGWGDKAGQFNCPYGVAVDPAGNVYVADARNDRIQKFSAQGLYLAAFGENGTGPGQLVLPKSVALDQAGNLYIADVGNRRIQKLTPEGKYIEEWGSHGKLPGQFDVPHDVAVDPWGDVYVADADGADHNNRIQVFFNDGTLATLWGHLGRDPGEFNFASRVALDPSGLNIYVCDASNNRIQLFTYAAQ